MLQLYFRFLKLLNSMKALLHLKKAPLSDQTPQAGLGSLLLSINGMGKGVVGVKGWWGPEGQWVGGGGAPGNHWVG